MNAFLPRLASLLLALPSIAAAQSLSPTSLAYDVSWGSTPLGTGTLTLTATGGDCYRYELATKPIGVVRWLYGSPNETSTFCVQNGAVVPSAMSFTNSKRPKDGFSLTFDFGKGQVLGGRNGALEIKPGTLDRLSVQQAARLWVKQNVGKRNPGTLVTPIADHKRVKAYTFAIRGTARVDTPAGNFEAVRFERIDDPKTTLRFWLAPEKDYMPVKVQHVEDGDPKVSLSLLSTAR
jgi:hypothetical protein